MDGRNVVDLSSFMLFEATGDSEVDTDLNLAALSDDKMEDDVQSCSCDTSDSIICLNDQLNDFHQLEYVRDDDNHGDDDDDDDDDENDAHEDEDEDEDDDAVNQGWTTDQMALPNASTVSGYVMARKHHKSKVTYVDSNMDLMNQRDKDRLFWENCLAS